MAIFLIHIHLLFHELLLLIREQGEIELVAEIPGHRDISSHSERRDPADLMVRHRGYVRPHRADRIDKTRAVLDFQPFHRIRVVARPGLRHVIQHAGVESASAARAAFEQNVRERRSQLLHQLV
ncbi:hypothetical protein D3C86_1667840 [compost metagenome]